MMVNKNDDLAPDTDYAAIRDEVENEIREELGPDALVETGLGRLESLESEVGLREVDVDPAVLDTIPADDTTDYYDADDDGVDDSGDRPETVSDLPQEMTESYGTGLQGRPSDRAGRYSRRADHQIYNEPDAVLTGGDVDANYEQASVVGDEAVGGTVPTPDQDITEELAAAAGVEIDDYTDVRINDMLEERDDRRWELDPKSSEDYQERRA